MIIITDVKRIINLDNVTKIVEAPGEGETYRIVAHMIGGVTETIKSGIEEGEINDEMLALGGAIASRVDGIAVNEEDCEAAASLD